MSELRRDPVVGRWVIVAPERARRPSDFRRPSPPVNGALCPFCPGNEGLTEKELLAVRPAPGAPWSLRVVANRYPALRVESEGRREGEGLFDRMEGLGAHEVVIETSDHERDLGDLSAAGVEAVLGAWAERLRDLSRDQRLRAAVVFKNRGFEAGATLGHAHSQIVALPMVPHAVAEEMDGAAAHFELKERCIYCDVVRQELRDGVRVVAESADVVAIAPWASRAPFETWLLPKRHEAHFEAEPAAVLKSVAELLRDVLRRLDVALERPPYQLVLHSAPLRERDLVHYHWHLELAPVVARQAGFEAGSGFAINPVPPEEAAAALRAARAE
jgi:UDPglucose--hexose-1-phosphate uridylyltransferase